MVLNNKYVCNFPTEDNVLCNYCCKIGDLLVYKKKLFCFKWPESIALILICAK